MSGIRIHNFIVNPTTKRPRWNGFSIELLITHSTSNCLFTEDGHSINYVRWVYVRPLHCVCCLQCSRSIDSMKGPDGSISDVVGLSNNSYKPITNTAWIRALFYKLQKGCTGLAAASDKVYQLLTLGRWFSPGTPASSTTKSGRHEIAQILLKVALSTIDKYILRL